ncbi:hypothetical protein QSI_1065 [Clostridioides difficile P28]|nr:hypothetical protein QSI_1065 [Clostridioides difficile P28]
MLLYNHTLFSYSILKRGASFLLPFVCDAIHVLSANFFIYYSL